MQTRREFLKHAGAISLSTFLLPTLAESSKLKNFGIQLYTLRDVIQKDTKNILSQLSKAGYTQLEAYGLDNGTFFGMQPKDFKKMTGDLGLKTIGSHAMPGRIADKNVKDGIDVFAPKWKKTVEAAAEGGLKYITQPWLEENYRKTGDDIKQTAESFNKLGEYAKSQGLIFTYHNHDFEFKTVDGKIIYDSLLTETDPKIVNFEMDLFWVTIAGKDPIAYFNQYPGRFHQWHIKDMNKANRDENTDLGKGSVDFVKLFQQAKKAGTKYFFVEQESGYNPDSITSSIHCAEYLKGLAY